ncbi:MAG: hypothetical protein Q8R02_15450 [Hyphomonadaceae bacterium]|nr:hypothetical protein [Hyphomonadaceae bacterium]
MPASAMKRLSFTLGALALMAMGAEAQTPSDWKAPRNSFGQPDLQGTWNSGSLTNLERTAQYKDLIVPDAQAEQAARQRYAANQRAQARTDQSAGAPTDRNSNAGYNAFWLDRGSTLGKVKGTYRSSWIVDPPDGRIPFSAEGRKLAAAAEARLGYSDPESRPLPDRCIASVGRNGPPMMNGLYNNHFQIAQSPTHVVIHAEMMSNARIVALTDRRQPSAIAPFFGDSIGRWEGDTLVVETTSFNPYHSWQDHPAFLSDKAKVTERFTRTAADELLYEFTIDDPTFYSQPWKGEMTWVRDGEISYEFACHEGNYAMPGILAGARVFEAQGRPLEQGAGE